MDPLVEPLPCPDPEPLLLPEALPDGVDPLPLLLPLMDPLTRDPEPLPLPDEPLPDFDPEPLLLPLADTEPDPLPAGQHAPAKIFTPAAVVPTS